MVLWHHESLLPHKLFVVVLLCHLIDDLLFAGQLTLKEVANVAVIVALQCENTPEKVTHCSMTFFRRLFQHLFEFLSWTDARFLNLLYHYNEPLRFLSDNPVGALLLEDLLKIEIWFEFGSKNIRQSISLNKCPFLSREDLREAVDDLPFVASRLHPVP